MFPFLGRFTDLGPWWFAGAVALLDAIAIVRALLRGHGVASTLAWILAVLALPGVGALAYLLLANPSVRRAVRRRAGIAAAAAPLPHSLDTACGDGTRIRTLAAELSGLQGTTGNKVELLVEDEHAFDQIGSALEKARESIWAEYYIVKNDETGHRFLDLLAERARAGVKVHLIHDAVGSMGLDSRRLDALREAGGRVTPFLPVNPLRRRWAVHLRNHRKLVVVDSVVAFTGGMNVGDEYSGRSRRRGALHFRDTHLRIEGPAAQDLAEVFADDWRFATGEALAVPGPSAIAPGQALVCPLPSGPEQMFNASAHVYFAGIMAARQRCFLTSPYFIPDEPTVRALITAAKSGVDVRILVPARCDVPIVGAAARSFFHQLLCGGVRVLEYQPAMLHAKSMVVDSRWGIVGSANVDMRSLRLNFEIGVAVFDPAFASGLEQLFETEQAASREVTIAEIDRAPLPRRLGQNTARLLSPLL